ncbi:ABC transporter permease [Arthrobacter sp. NPDC055138]
MKLHPLLAGTMGLLAAGVLWEAVAVGPMAGTALPSLSSTLQTLVSDASGQEFWTSTLQTVGVALLGLTASAAGGVLLGVLIGSFPSARYATLAVVEFLKPIPPIVVLPLVVLIFGPTPTMAWVLVIIGCLVPILMQTISGVDDTDPVARDTARSFGMGQAEILFRIVLPSALPFIGTAMRIAAPISLVVAVVAGLLGGGPGLGRSIFQAQAAGNYPSLYGLVLVLGFLGLCFIGGSRAIERRLLHWHESYREVSV